MWGVGKVHSGKLSHCCWWFWCDCDKWWNRERANWFFGLARAAECRYMCVCASLKIADGLTSFGGGRASCAKGLYCLARMHPASAARRTGSSALANYVRQIMSALTTKADTDGAVHGSLHSIKKRHQIWMVINNNNQRIKKNCCSFEKPKIGILIFNLNFGLLSFLCAPKIWRANKNKFLSLIVKIRQLTNITKKTRRIINFF